MSTMYDKERERKKIDVELVKITCLFTQCERILLLLLLLFLSRVSVVVFCSITCVCIVCHVVLSSLNEIAVLIQY